jgi:hypothetical protein
MSDLDSGIEYAESNIQIIKNPLFGTLNLEIIDPELKHVTLMKLKKHFNRVLILCSLNLNNVKEVSKKLFSPILDEETFTVLKSSLILIDSGMNILNNQKHLVSSLLIEKDVLEDYNKFNLDLNENELVVPIINIDYLTLIEYVNQYKNKNDLKSIYNLMLLNQEFPTSNKLLISNMSSKIMNLDDANYWTYTFNCFLNMSNEFLKRDFDFKLVKRFDQTISIIHKISKLTLNDLQNDDYLNVMFNHQKYVDAKCAVEKKGYKLYYIAKNCEFNNEDINNMFTKIISSIDYYSEKINNIKGFENLESKLEKYKNIVEQLEKQKYDLFNNLLVSKKYCHLIVNNHYILKLMKSHIEKYIGLYRYLWGYPMLTLYIEESIKRTTMTGEDRFVVRINTANSFPIFPYFNKDPTLNPYMPIMIDNDLLDTDTNIGGIKYSTTIPKENRGITDLNGFRKNLNIFLTGNSDSCVLNNVDMTNLAFSGSCITACSLKYHPLIQLFEGLGLSDDLKISRFYEEYYGKSDVDVICNIQDPFEYIDKVHQFRSDIFKGMNGVEEIDLQLNLNKKVAIIIDKKFVNLVIKQEKTNLSFDFITQNMRDNIEVKKLFYNYYLDAKKTYIEEKFSDFDDDRLSKIKETYYDIFSTVSIEDLVVIYINEPSVYYREDDFRKDVQNYSFSNFEMLKDQTFFFKFYENFKYRLVCPKFLKKELEIFQPRYKDFFATVSRFHLPCVRGYYNGDDVYLLPSCIFSLMTFQNIDYKYFAGSKDPVEIINKNRTRGFGVFLNPRERYQYVNYSYEIDKWNKQMNLTSRKFTVVKEILGNLNLNNNFFKPKGVEIGLTNTIYADISDNKYVESEEDVLNDLKTNYNWNEPELLGKVLEKLKGKSNTLALRHIDKNGYPIPYDPEMSQLFWKLF